MMAGANEEPFRTLFEPHRRSITLHCYRMLGSLQDAEEIVQEALLRAWQRRDEVRDPSAVRSWLYKIATNACLDQLLKARRRRALPHLVGPALSTFVGFGPAADERMWVEPLPDDLLGVADDAVRSPDERASTRESVGLAFITALQSLSPKQRAALLLVDVLGWKPDEVAALLEVSAFSVNSLLQRARKRVEAAKADDVAPALSGTDTDLLRRFISAWERGDLEAFSALLADDALLSMPPQPEWYAGRDAIVQFFAAVWSKMPGQRRLVALTANGRPAIAVYRRAVTPNPRYEPSGIMLLTLREGLVAQMIRFDFPKLFPLFGLPPQLGSDGNGDA